MRSSLNNDLPIAEATDAVDPEADAAPRWTLATAGRDQPLRVVGVAGADALALRLRASGLWDDAVVEVVGAAPFGDPLLIQVHGFRLALRRNEAERVAVVEVRS